MNYDHLRRLRQNERLVPLDGGRRRLRHSRLAEVGLNAQVGICLPG